MAAALALFPTAVFCGPLQFVRAGGGFVFFRCIGPFIAEEQPELCVVDLFTLRAEKLASQEVDPLLEKLVLASQSRNGLFRGFDG